MTQPEIHKRKPGTLSPQGLLLTAIIAACGFILITLLVFNKTTPSADQQAIDAAISMEAAGLNKLILAVTWLGNYQFLVPANLVLIFYFLKKKQKKTAWLVFLIAITGLGLKFLLKALFARPRPDNPIVKGIENYSYPSGHALMSVAFYGLLILLINEIAVPRFWRGVIVFISLLLILLIGFSRVYLRVHYPTDVLAGYCLGIIWVCLPLYIFNRRYQNLGL